MSQGRDASSPLATRRALAYALLGVGAAGLVASLTAGAFVIDRLNTADEHCPHDACDARGFAATQSGQTLYVAAIASFAVALAAAGGAGYLLWLAPEPGRRDVAAMPLVAPHSAGAQLRARF